MLENQISVTPTGHGKAVLVACLQKSMWTAAVNRDKVLVYNVFQGKDGSIRSINSVVERAQLPERQHFLNGSDVWLFRAAKTTSTGQAYMTGCIAPFKLPSTIRQNAQGISITVLLEKTSEQAYEGSSPEVVEIRPLSAFIS